MRHGCSTYHCERTEESLAGVASEERGFISLSMTKRCAHPQRTGSDGVALLIVLWVVIILSTLVVSLSYQAKMDIKMMGYQMAEVRARYLARAGLARALVYLREDVLKDNDDFPEDRDPIIDILSEDEGAIMPYDAYLEAWHNNPDNYEDVEIGAGTLNVKVLDESARLNLNSPYVLANQDVVKGLLLFLGHDEDTAQEVSAAIIDWIDADSEPSDGGDWGEWGDEQSEDTYYNPDQDSEDILEFGPRYVNKNGPLDTVEELLLIRGVTPWMFYGEDANNNLELDDNEDDGDLNPPPDNEDGVLQLGLRDFVTVYSNQYVNLNTAPWQVLAALLYPIYEEEAEDVAREIVEYRDGSDRTPGTDDDRPMRTLDDSDGDGYDFTQVDNFTEADLRSLGSVVTRGSDYFRVVSTGEVHGVRKTLTAIVWREYNPNRLTRSESLGLEPTDDEEIPQKVILTILEYNEDS